MNLRRSTQIIQINEAGHKHNNPQNRGNNQTVKTISEIKDLLACWLGFNNFVSIEWKFGYQCLVLVWFFNKVSFLYESIVLRHVKIHCNLLAIKKKIQLGLGFS